MLATATAATRFLSRHWKFCPIRREKNDFVFFDDPPYRRRPG
jgi:site-specific DNA-adenine methylase